MLVTTPISLGRLDEGAVGFVGLDDHPLSRADTGVRAPGVDDAAGDDRRVEAGLGEHVRDERGRRRLAVRAGDRHGRGGAHQLGQHLGAADDGEALGARRLELGIAALDRRRDDDVRRPIRFVASWPMKTLDALVAQAADVGAVLLIAAAHRSPSRAGSRRSRSCRCRRCRRCGTFRSGGASA